MIGDVLQHISLAKLAAFAVALYWVFSFLRKRQTEQQIQRLGGHAPSRNSWIPGGVDVGYQAAKALANHESWQFFQDGLNKYANPNHPYTLEITMASERLIMTADDQNIKAILATQFNDYGKGPDFHKQWNDFLGKSVFTTDGEMWHNARMLIRPLFVKERLSDIAYFEKHCQVLIPLLGGSHPGQTVDVLDLFFRFTLDASTDFLLGRSADSLHSGQSGFADAFNYIQHIMAIRMRLNKLEFLLPMKRFHSEIKVLNEFVEPYIEDALALSPEELEKRTKTDDGYTFLHALASFTRDRTVLRDQLVAILLAGRDTTACSLSWLFYELSLQPQTYKKLRQEILVTVGSTGSPTYENLKSMKYLQNCINEVLRLYPIVPFNVRVALRDTTLPSGGGADGKQPIGILKGTQVGYSTLTMQRRPDIYPHPSTGFPDINAFVPERWQTWTPKPWTYIPFNGGPRLCIGQQFALTEMAYTITRIMQVYDGLENKMAAPPKYRTDIVIQPACPVELVFRRAEKS